MIEQKFNYNIADSQSTTVNPVSQHVFDFDAYEKYEASLLDKCQQFRQENSGVMVYRRMRVTDVFSSGCQDMEKSLHWQLGALAKSMKFKADIPNFLEPWYGIGTVASAFGAEYFWEGNQAPATRPKFQSITEALKYNPRPIAQTSIGKHTLEMIDYFVEQTAGRLPISLTDTQSPLNIACSLVDINNFFMEMMDNPEGVKTLLDRIADLQIDFIRIQAERIGQALVWPGHGFASSRYFDGLGMSDDQAIMLSPDIYKKLTVPSFEKCGKPFGGAVFHSCGNWSSKIEIIKKITNLRMVDGAFSAFTDPQPNVPVLFSKSFVNTGIVVNSRIVGDVDTISDTVSKLWQPGMKLIVVTYCQTAQEQAEAYERIHLICSEIKE